MLTRNLVRAACGLSAVMTILSTNADAADGGKKLVLIQDAKAHAAIVISPTAGDRIKKAAKTLQDYLSQSTGVELPIVNAPREGLVSINIGQTPGSVSPDLTALDLDGFILQGMDDKTFAIVGGSDQGTEYGVYEFLERYVGVRWLMPTDIGADVPKLEALIVSTDPVRQEPTFLLRNLSPLKPEGQNATDLYPRYPEWCRFNRLNDQSRMNFHHNMRELLPPSLFAKAHPEYYPYVDMNKPMREFRERKDELKARLVEGRYIPANDKDHRWQPNFSAPGIVDACAERIIEFFKENPGINTYSLGSNDTANFDQSPESLARRTGQKNYLGLEDVSDDYFTWANAVVEKVLQIYPDKWFGVLAYSQLAQPPTRVKLHPRIVPFLTYELLRWTDPELKAANQKVNVEWQNAANSIGWWDYIYGNQYLVPRVYPHQMQDYLIWGSQHKVKYVFAELYPNWGEGPKGWIYCKLLWNPEQNVDVLLDEWYNGAVGAAAAPKLKEYYSIWEKFWTDDVRKSAWWEKSFNIGKFERQYLSFNDLAYLQYVPESAIKESDALMQEVVRLADTPLQKKRAEKLQQMWQFYKLSWYSYQGERMVDSVDADNVDQVLAALEKAEQYFAITDERQVLFKSFENDPLYRDVYLRQYAQEWPRRGAKWGEGLITKAQKLAKTDPRVAGKLKQLSSRPNQRVSGLAKSIL